ncbi:MAG: membrane protein insertase YidC [bacterium]
MNDNLRMLIGFVIIVLILILYPMFLPRKTKSLPVSDTIQTQTRVEPAHLETSPLTPAAPTPTPVPETTAVLENQFLAVEFTSFGGGIKSLYLKRYQVQLIPENSSLLGNPELTQLPVTLTQTESTVTFTYHLPEGHLTKTWAIEKDYSFLITFNNVPPNWNLKFDAQSGIPVTEKEIKEDLTNFHFYARTEGKIHQISYGQVRKKPLVTNAEWVGLKSKYFFLALVNLTARFDSVGVEPLTDNRIGFTAPAKTTGNANFLVYAGPIEYNRLRSFNLGFENVVSLGWLKPVALGILYLLRLFYFLVRNWGWAIVIFSALMKGIFYPLSRTQLKQMRQLQLLQPKIEELKKKYKDNPQMLNQETMRIYQLYKVNPLSGCLPLLVQMPVFFALYAVLRNFIELRGAEFILWLKDLSQPDTLFGHIPRGVPLVGGFAVGLLPILMGVSFIFQNLMTSTDKRNRAMTIVFPIFITAIFLNLSSGLQLYWFMYNILSILESVIVTKGGYLWQKIKKSPTLGVV